ncbi:MAG: bifunctional DNA-formamidopyrimidine glycosylase/DNA-(apurinic or apyrimidinic site) lyase [Alphaproteobacteria bacterium]|nr:bifunctional DNA-formamidopyrimidine glycosylase/DNA-(apurinic or apyrimidinic site) lyase [Alphaproteobacteria bacterium]
MPELPEVETTRQGLLAALDGQVLQAVEARVPALRFPLPVDLEVRLAGRKVTGIERRAKYLLIALEDSQVLLVHLGMSGRMRVFPAGTDRPPLEKHDHVIFRTEEGSEIRFNDARRFGSIDLMAADEVANHPLLRDLGPEPLGNAFSGPVLAAQLRGRRTPIKAALLDQKTVAGLGNIYVCEALYFANLSPRRGAYTVQGARAEQLARSIRQVLNQAIAAGGSSLRDFQHVDGELGYFQNQFAVYRREGECCPRCVQAGKTTGCIRRIVQSGRSTFYCSHWQR